MSYDYVKSGSGESEPYLSSSSASNTSEKRTAFIVGGLVSVYTLTAVILLIVFAFSNHTLFPNVSMVVLIFLLYINVVILYKWATSADVDDKFKYILAFGVVMLVVANTVGIIYAVTRTGEDCPVITCPDPPLCTTCSGAEFFLPAASQCYPLCSEPDPYLYIFVSDNVTVDCTNCPPDTNNTDLFDF